jgi:hypothetical protein
MVNRPPPQRFTSPIREEAAVEAPAFIERPPLRQPVESSMDRAARRTLELRGHFTGGVLDEGADEFYINPAIIPEGWSYEWKLYSILNEEQSSYQVSLARTGWEPVPADRHPELMPRGTKEKTVMRRGMQLMERPLEITMEAKQIEREKARRQVRIKEDQLTAAPPGQFGRDNKGVSLAHLGKSYEAMPVPEKI